MARFNLLLLALATLMGFFSAADGARLGTAAVLQKQLSGDHAFAVNLLEGAQVNSAGWSWTTAFRNFFNAIKQRFMRAEAAEDDASSEGSVSMEFDEEDAETEGEYVNRVWYGKEEENLKRRKEAIKERRKKANEETEQANEETEKAAAKEDAAADDADEQAQLEADDDLFDKEGDPVEWDEMPQKTRTETLREWKAYLRKQISDTTEIEADAPSEADIDAQTEGALGISWSNNRQRLEALEKTYKNDEVVEDLLNDGDDDAADEQAANTNYEEQADAQNKSQEETEEAAGKEDAAAGDAGAADDDAVDAGDVLRA